MLQNNSRKCSRWFDIGLFASLLLLIVLALTWAFIPKQDFQLSLVHFNDFHARFEEVSKSATKCIPDQGCIGGFARIFTAINTIKKQRPDTVVLNAGDSFQGTLWYNLLKWNVTQFFMNMLPLDAHTLGNHEFDDGIAGLVPYIKHLEAPVLVSNIDDSEEPTLRGTYRSIEVIERKGRRIGIIGVILKTTNLIAATGKLRFTDEAQAVKKEADRMAAEGIDIIIVLSHCGVDVDKEIAANAGSNIDIIVGGHTHTLLYPKNMTTPSGEMAIDDYPIYVNQNTNNTVLVVQASAYSKYLGNLRVDFDDDGKIIRWEGVPIYLDDSIKQDEDVLKSMQPFKDQVDELGKRELGVTKVRLDRSTCYGGECNIGNFLTDAFVDFLVAKSEPDQWTYAAACIMNQGGIRTNIEIGVIKYEDLIIAQPFANYMRTFEIKGKHLLEAFEHASGESIVPELFMGQFMVQVSGIKLVYNVSNPVGKRLLEAEIRCNQCEVPSYSTIELETIYRFAAPNFIADGGDGFLMLSNNKINEKTWDVDVDILEKYIAKESPITTGLEGRITVYT